MTFDDYLDRASEEAWKFAAGLEQRERPGGPRLAALFPTNHAKPQSATTGFRHFAIGQLQRGRDGGQRRRPLFAWKVCALIEEGRTRLVAPTPRAYELLEALAGIDLGLPHRPEHALTFLEAC